MTPATASDARSSRFPRIWLLVVIAAQMAEPAWSAPVPAEKHGLILGSSHSQVASSERLSRMPIHGHRPVRVQAPVAVVGDPNVLAMWMIPYMLLVVAGSLLGGWIPGRVKMTHARIQYIISFVAGLMLGIALLHLLPHAFLIGERVSVDVIVGCVLFGILAIFALLRVFHFHVHEPESLVSEAEAQPSAVVVAHGCSSPEHSHHTQADHDGQEPVTEPGARFGWAGVLVGLTIHTLIDGLALGAAMASDLALDPKAILPGVGILAAIAMHKPLDSMSITSLMAVAGWSRQMQTVVNVTFALLCPIGAALFFLGMTFVNSSIVACSLAFSAGVFLCVALSDLLPEMKFHTHDRMTLSIALTVGVVLAWAMRLIEPAHMHG